MVCLNNIRLVDSWLSPYSDRNTNLIVPFICPGIPTAEEFDLKSNSCGFESHPGYHYFKP